MLATLICTECGDPWMVTDRSVVLPFVCRKCKQEESNDEKENEKE